MVLSHLFVINRYFIMSQKCYFVSWVLATTFAIDL